MSKARAVVITPLGHAILAKVKAGTYTYHKQHGRIRAGQKMHKGKPRSKFRAPCYAK